MKSPDFPGTPELGSRLALLRLPRKIEDLPYRHATFSIRRGIVVTGIQPWPLRAGCDEIGHIRISSAGKDRIESR